MSKQLILASASPRRREILETAGYSFGVITSNADELSGGFDAAEVARLNALEKAREVFARIGKGGVVVGADTVVTDGKNILGKPSNRNDAFLMLKALSGKKHSVITGFAVVGESGEESGACTTAVEFKRLSDAEITAYVATGECDDKAGAYGIQEKASLFVKSIEGDFFNVVGLPVARISETLSKYGVLPDWQKEVE